MNPSISVIIPTWNSAQTLPATIQSCLNQTVPVLEVLVCDDGSADNSKHIVESMQDPRIRWVAGEHSGTPAVPRNAGMRLAQGEWLAFCDSDDQWLPEKMERQLSAMKSLGCLACSTNAIIKRDGTVTSQAISGWQKERIAFKNLLRSNDVICSSTVLHRSIFQEIGGFPEHFDFRSFEDYAYWLRVATKTRFAFIKEPLVVYDDHPLTSIRSRGLSDIEMKRKVFADIAAWLKGRPRVRHARMQLFLAKLRKAILHTIYE